MTDKTTVTKDTVPESVKKEIWEEGRQQAKAEFDRQQQDLSEKVSLMESEKAELESRYNELSAAEQRRLDSLNDETRIARNQLQQLETDPGYAGVREKFKVEGTRIKSEAIDESVGKSTHETSKILMSEYLDRKAEEEKISVKQLKDELNAVLKVPGSDRIKFPDLMPHERVKEAYRERSERKRIQMIEDENKRLKAERDGFSEEGMRQPRDSRPVRELREAHIGGDKSAGISLSSDLDRRQAELDSQNK